MVQQNERLLEIIHIKTDSRVPDRNVERKEHAKDGKGRKIDPGEGETK